MKWWFAAFIAIWLAGGLANAIDMPNTDKVLTQIGLLGFVFMCGVSLGRAREKPESQ
jgi:hypothetical protein